MTRTKELQKTDTAAALVDGLTVDQINAAQLIAGGESFTTVAAKIHVSRATLYRWTQTPPFFCYINQIRQDARKVAENQLFSLVGEAVNALRGCLNSPNDTTRLNAAKYILERVGEIQTGTTDPIAAIEEQHTTDAAENWGTMFTDDAAVKRDIKRYNLQAWAAE